MKAATLTNAQARTFLLRHHGLIGDHVFEGKQGVMDYIRQCGCIQFDPVDVCGQNAQLVLQSRVKGFTKPMLAELLYKDRMLLDYFDKNLAIFPVEDWPYFARERVRQMEGSWHRQEAVVNAADAIREVLRERECVSSAELGMDDKIRWDWGNATRVSRVTLESLYFRGELGIHHKKGTIKHYAPVERLFPKEIIDMPDPHTEDADFRDWQTLRRIGAVGFLRNRASDAFLCARYHKGGGRAAAFDRLIGDGRLIALHIEGMGEPVYARAEEEALLDEILSGATYEPRMEVIAPLDCFMWDRKLIAKLFGFAYTWEIYTPEEKRQYGYYVLPVVRGETLAGRVDVAADWKNKVLRMKGVWWEGRSYKGELRKCLKRLAKFNDCKEVEGL